MWMIKVTPAFLPSSGKLLTISHQHSRSTWIGKILQTPPCWDLLLSTFSSPTGILGEHCHRADVRRPWDDIWPTAFISLYKQCQKCQQYQHWVFIQTSQELGNCPMVGGYYKWPKSKIQNACVFTRINTSSLFIKKDFRDLRWLAFYPNSQGVGVVLMQRSPGQVKTYHLDFNASCCSLETCCNF